MTLEEEKESYHLTIVIINKKSFLLLWYFYNFNL